MTTTPAPAPLPTSRLGTTAYAAAAARAAHLEVDESPHLLVDDLAASLLGDGGAGFLGYQRAYPDEPVLATARLWAVARSRFAEERLVASDARQYVVLGAGLDTSALRVAAPSGRTAFEVDLPGASAAKLTALAQANVVLPDAVRLVPADLRDPEWPAALVDAGLDPTEPAFVACLGVTMYLTPDEVRELALGVATLAPGSELVLDHVLPAGLRDEVGETYARGVAAVAAQVGEPWRCEVAPRQMAAFLSEAGLAVEQAVDLADAVAPLLRDRTDALRPVRIAGVVHARVPAPSPRQAVGARS
jgi:methyltransferase (TIGR00027 family)